VGAAVRYTLAGVEKLQALAEKTAGELGHKLGTWRVSQYNADFICYSYCPACFDGVVIDTRAEEVVSGSALREDCDPDRLPF